MRRREVLAVLLGSAALHGCRPSDGGGDVKLDPVTPDEPENSTPQETTEAEVEPEKEPLEGMDLTPVKVDPKLQIREVVGLRPFRSSGFVVRKDEIEGKTIIHNYGHGGGGMTLSWGSSYLAVQQMETVSGLDCAVIGGGVMGLSTARLLQLRGAKVTIYTDLLPPLTTSNMSGAQWWPVSVSSQNGRTEPFIQQFVEAAKFSFRYFQNLVGPDWGVRWIPNYYLSSREHGSDWLDGPNGVLHELQIDFKDFGPGEHIFPQPHVRRFNTMLIEPATYLNRLLNEVLSCGAQLVVRKFETKEEILGLEQNCIFNCTGLGSHHLFNDENLMPIKGQLCVLMPQPEVNYNLISGLSYMFPRSDGIIMGGSYERRNWDPNPSPQVAQRIFRDHKAIFDAMLHNQEEQKRLLKAKTSSS